MKANILKLFAVIVLMAVSMFFYNEGNASSLEKQFSKATCPITINFCVNSVGGPVVGAVINIYDNGSCSGNLVAQITTGSNGCAQYTFNSHCNQTFSINLTCTGSPSDCVSFVPDTVGDNGNVNINPCP